MSNKAKLDAELEHAKSLEEKFYSSETKDEQTALFIQFLDCFKRALTLLDEMNNNEEIRCSKMSRIMLDLCDRRDAMLKVI